MGLLNSNSLNEWAMEIPDRAKQMYAGLLDAPRQIGLLFDPKYMGAVTRNALSKVPPGTTLANLPEEQKQKFIWDALEATGMAPIGMAGVVSPAKQQEIRAMLEALSKKENTKRIVRNAVELPEESIRKLSDSPNRAGFPSYKRKTLDMNVAHIYDSRMSGEIKPDGKKADQFGIDDIMNWIVSAGDDSATVVQNNNGAPYLTNLYKDTARNKEYPVEMPVFSTPSGYMSIGGLVPIGVWK